MKNKKYVICSGLAFADVEDMEALRQYALDGWIFREYKGFWYVLYKEEPQDLIFSYDMQKVKKEELHDYVQMFEEAGWHMIKCKDDTVHFFWAKAGTMPLHTDKETRKNQFRMPFYLAIVALVLGIVLLLCAICFDCASWMGGLGGGLIGGGGMLFIGCALRLRGHRWKAVLTFRKACLVTLFGLGLFLAGKLLPQCGVGTLTGKIVACIGIMIAIYGFTFILAQYRVFKDKKEIGGKLDD